MEGRGRNVFPDTETLIDISIHEKLPDDVLHWYNQRKYKRTEEKHRDQAIEIWKKMAANEIAQTKPKAYRQAAVYMKKIQALLKKANRFLTS
ncbi:MAG: hypothetical protein V1689_12505 [Pseudomonadota bacterium]